MNTKKDMEQETHNVSDQVLAKIQKEHLSPRSKWRFLFHDYSVWAVSLFSLTVGSISFGLFLTILLGNDWDVYKKTEENMFTYNLSIIPYLWLVFVALFIFYANYFFKNTDKGYRYKQAGVAIGSIAVSAIFGTILYYTGIAQDTDDYFVATVPCYHQIAGHRTDVWSLPHKGLLAGTVGSSTANGFLLTDFSGRNWIIVGVPMEVNQKGVTQYGKIIKVVGNVAGDGMFKASEVRSWSGKMMPPKVCGIKKCAKNSC